MAEDDIRTRLLNAAIELFGRDGANAVGTRAIADAAGAQMSAITYYFGGKDGLYLACARHIAETMSGRVRPVLEGALALCAQDGGPAAARDAVCSIMAGFVQIMMRDDVAPLSRFVVREQMNPTPAFAELYDGAMGQVIGRLGELIQRIAGGRLSEEELRVRTIALMGQIFAFRFARAALMRSTGWDTVGERETDLVRAVVLAHARAILDELQQKAAP